ncbi:uncharacterized protein AAG666_009393 [Megaptera novaeangliae]
MVFSSSNCMIVQTSIFQPPGPPGETLSVPSVLEPLQIATFPYKSKLPFFVLWICLWSSFRSSHIWNCSSIDYSQEQEESKHKEPGRKDPSSCSTLECPLLTKLNIVCPLTKEKCSQGPSSASQNWAMKFTDEDTEAPRWERTFPEAHQQVAVQFSQHHLLKRLSFLHCISLPPLS